MPQPFHLGDILSVTTRRLVSPQGVDGLYAILSYMTGDDVFTHQLGRFADECKRSLEKEMPWLTLVDETGVADWQAWLPRQVAQYGEYHEVSPIPQKDHAVIDPIEELCRMGVGEDNIIVLADEHPS